MKYLAALFTLFASPALAGQNTCLPLDQLEAKLAAEYKETESAAGLSGDGTLLMLFQSEGGATFTMVKVTTERLACVVDYGTDLQTKAPEALPEGQGS